MIIIKQNKGYLKTKIKKTSRFRSAIQVKKEEPEEPLIKTHK